MNVHLPACDERDRTLQTRGRGRALNSHDHRTAYPDDIDRARALNDGVV